jgi:hypothetical protein
LHCRSLVRSLSRQLLPSPPRAGFFYGAAALRHWSAASSRNQQQSIAAPLVFLSAPRLHSGAHGQGTTQKAESGHPNEAELTEKKETIMNTKLIALALSSLLATGTAMADGGAFGQLGRDAQSRAQAASSTTGSAVSRAAVIAELQRARQNGELARRDAESYNPSFTLTTSTKTRAQVLAELQAARASGELDQLNSNNPSFAQLLALKKDASAATELLAGQPATAR